MSFFRTLIPFDLERPTCGKGVFLGRHKPRLHKSGGPAIPRHSVWPRGKLSLGIC